MLIFKCVEHVSAWVDRTDVPDRNGRIRRTGELTEFTSTGYRVTSFRYDWTGKIVSDVTGS